MKNGSLNAMFIDWRSITTGLKRGCVNGRQAIGEQL
jgi:hypothetical protein